MNYEINWSLVMKCTVKLRHTKHSAASSIRPSWKRSSESNVSAIALRIASGGTERWSPYWNCVNTTCHATSHSLTVHSTASTQNTVNSTGTSKEPTQIRLSANAFPSSASRRRGMNKVKSSITGKLARRTTPGVINRAHSDSDSQTANWRTVFPAPSPTHCIDCTDCIDWTDANLMMICAKHELQCQSGVNYTFYAITIKISADWLGRSRHISQHSTDWYYCASESSAHSFSVLLPWARRRCIFPTVHRRWRQYRCARQSYEIDVETHPRATIPVQVHACQDAIAKRARQLFITVNTT